MQIIPLASIVHPANTVHTALRASTVLATASIHHLLAYRVLHVHPASATTPSTVAVSRVAAVNTVFLESVVCVLMESSQTHPTRPAARAQINFLESVGGVVSAWMARTRMSTERHA